MTTDNEGWITHDGGEIPVEASDKVECVTPNGTDCGNAHMYDWNIVRAYRLLIPKHELETAQTRIAELEAELAQWQQWEDKPDELSEVIDACHPMQTKTHDLYAKAHELVSNRHSKGALVGLVHYLLCQEDKAIKAQCDLIAVLEKMATCDSNYGAHAFEYREMASVALAVLAKGKGGQS